ncbi:hypothetical protein AB205_0048000 [Aquarana catesbeiana]|uniref:Thromboxane-A synthase n=1 Tax=Aquarana catesbeiana TaxID=8400 RepID=A0A2G9RYM6_AQUCT|nr:hypothetical protein AB205_0048000 [Aquarana catesbeiana]
MIVTPCACTGVTSSWLCHSNGRSPQTQKEDRVKAEALSAVTTPLEGFVLWFAAEEKQKQHPFSYLPFGAGPRSCIGMRLAILEAKITLYRVLQKFRFETSSRTQIPLQVTTLSTLRPKDGVYVKVVGR